MMRLSLFLPAALLLLAALPAGAQETARPSQLQADLQLERKLLVLDLVSYREARTREQVARERVTTTMQRLDQALAGDSLALGTLETLFDELTMARATAAAAAEQLDWQVRRLQERMRRISFLEGEIDGPGVRATLAGRWQMQISPTNQAGALSLQVDGTAISGTYDIQGGTSGSVRGNLVGNRVQLELLDTAGELESTFTGTYDPSTRRMTGTWLATEMAQGRPVQGTWIATRAGVGNER